MKKFVLTTKRHGDEGKLCLRSIGFVCFLGNRHCFSKEWQNQVGIVRVKRTGIPDKIPNRYGSQKGLLNMFGITAENLEETVLSVLSKYVSDFRIYSFMAGLAACISFKKMN